MKEIIIEQQKLVLSLKEVCLRCHINAEKVIQFVDYGLVEPEGETHSDWLFSPEHYLRIRKALRLQRDLSVNEAGVVLVIDLLDRLKTANDEIQYLKKRIK